MSLYNGPPRGGSRGGKDQFNWENVKGDKFREYYLGASVHANTGRWQKDRDVFWYTREKDDQQASLEDELAAVKQREEDLMLEALGMKPKARKKVEMKARLDATEMKSLLQRGGPEADPGEDPGPSVPGEDEDVVRGLGFASGSMRILPAMEAATERMEGTAAEENPRVREGGQKEEYHGQRAGAAAASGAQGGEALASLRKLQKKAEKRSKKEAKKAKKKSKDKREKKRKHKESSRRHSPASDDSDSDAERGRGGRGFAGGSPGSGRQVRESGGRLDHQHGAAREDRDKEPRQRPRSRSRSPPAGRSRAGRSPPREEGRGRERRGRWGSEELPRNGGHRRDGSHQSRHRHDSRSPGKDRRR